MCDEDIVGLVKLVKESQSIEFFRLNSFFSEIVIKKFGYHSKREENSETVANNYNAPQESKNNYVLLKTELIGMVLWEESLDEFKTLFGEGSKVSKGQVLGYISSHGELYSEIHSPCDGIVRKILKSSGERSEWGSQLLEIEPLEKA